MNFIDGKKISEEIAGQVSESVKKLGRKPVLSVVSISQNAAGESFMKAKQSFGEPIGIDVRIVALEADLDPETLRLSVLSVVQKSDGVVVQLPLPHEVDREKILNLIPERKDPDVLNVFSREAFENCKSKVAPPVAGAVEEILKRHNVEVKGRRVVIIGKGRLVGKPVAAWFACNGVLPHSLDKNDSEEKIREELSRADIVVSGVGVPSLVKPDMVKEGVVLVDAGTSGQSGQVRGDIDPACAEKASLFTPVPGGVGPIAVAKLFENLLVLINK